MSHFNDFVNYIYKLSQVDHVNEALERRVTDCLIDYTSAIIGGSRLWKERISHLLQEDSESGIYHLAGFENSVSLETAMLANGLMSHVAELDDGIIEGIIHPGAPVFSALLSVFQRDTIDWQIFVKAVTVGYEVACRIAEAIQPGHKLLGYHASATCGTLGVAAALAVAARLDRTLLKEALTIAMASSHGTLKVLEDGSELKPYNIASAVINGFVSFQMAKAGFKGADNPFEGESGFFAQMAKEINYSKLTAKNCDLCIFNVYFKPYASCRYTHPTLEAAMCLRAKLNHPDELIDLIKITTYSIAIRHHDHTEVPNVSSAKMCIPFAAAVGLLKGSGGIDAFCDETVQDARIKSLTKKVRVLEDKKYSAQFPKRSIATMTISTKDGHEYTATVDMPKGEPGNPMTYGDLLLKLKKSCDFANFEFEAVKEYVETIPSMGISDFFGHINKFISSK